MQIKSPNSSKFSQAPSQQLNNKVRMRSRNGYIFLPTWTAVLSAIIIYMQFDTNLYRGPELRGGLSLISTSVRPSPPSLTSFLPEKTQTSQQKPEFFRKLCLLSIERENEIDCPENLARSLQIVNNFVGKFWSSGMIKKILLIYGYHCIQSLKIKQEPYVHDGRPKAVSLQL